MLKTLSKAKNTTGISPNDKDFTLPAAFRETREILSTENCFRFVFMGFSLVYLQREQFVEYSDIVSLSRLVFSPFRFSSLTWERGTSIVGERNISFFFRTDVCIAVSIAVNAEISIVSGPQLCKAPTETYVCGFDVKRGYFAR